MYDDAPGDDGVMMGAAHRKHFIEGPVLFGSGRRLYSEICEFCCKPSTKIGNTCWIGRHSTALTLSSQCLRLSLIYEFLGCVRAVFVYRTPNITNYTHNNLTTDTFVWSSA